MINFTKLKRVGLLCGLMFTYSFFSGCKLIDKARCPDVTISYKGDVGDIFYPNVAQGNRAALPTLDPAPIGIYTIEPVDLGNNDKADVAPNIPNFNGTTGGFDVNNPNLVAGVRYTIKFQPSDDCYKSRSYSATFLIQGLAYKSGVYGPAIATLPPTYNGDGKTLLPTAIGAAYSFDLQDARQTILQRGDRTTPNAVVVNRDAQLDLRRIRQFFNAQPAPAQPLRLNIAYSFTDGNFPVAVRTAVEVYYFRSRADIPAALLARVTALARFPGGRAEDTFVERPPTIIIVDVL